MNRNRHLLESKFLMLGVFLACIVVPTGVFAATNIYYSAGQNVSDHKTGSPTVTISGNTATFSVAQTASSTGIGNIINYGGARAFITGKTSTTVWSVATATGTTPVATTTAPVTSITHAFASLAAAISGGQANNATSTNFLNTSNLVAGDYTLNIPFYRDTGSDAGNLNIRSYTTGPNNYIRVYTPTSTASEVNASQRHNGTFNTSIGASVSAALNGTLFTIGSPYVHIDGLQIRNTQATRSVVGISTGASADNRYFSNNIVSHSNNGGMLIAATGGTATARFHYFNNLFINGSIAISETSAFAASSTIENNTFYNNITGIQPYNNCTFAQGITIKNNIFASTTNPVTTGYCRGYQSGYNATASTSMGYSGGTGFLGFDRLSQTFTFTDAPNGDFSLASTDAGARNQGTSTVSLWRDFAYAIDIFGLARPAESVWDMGAFEYTPGADVSAPGRSAGAPSGEIASSTTSTTLSLNTNENATCKYSTTANTAYGSMANTFSTTGGTAHSQNISGLSDGNYYRYYVRCQDGSTNTNTDDYTIEFMVDDSGTAYAPSCSVTDVNAVYAYVEDGDVLRVPAGTCTGLGHFSFGFGKAITVQGAGKGVTIWEIASTTSGTNGVILVTAAATVKDLTIRTEGTSSSAAFSISANGFRITNIEYISNVTSTYLARVSTASYGLFDNLDVTGGGGSNELIFVTGPTNSWQTDHSLGKRDSIYIENSIFRGNGYVTDCNADSRCVVRNNVIEGTIKIDGHGVATNGPPRSVRHMEIYNNVWTASVNSNWTAVEMRGGSGLIFNNNSIATSTNAAVFYLRDYTYDNGQLGDYGGYMCAANYPIHDQIGRGKDIGTPATQESEPFYLWDNTKNGSQWPLTWRAISGTVLANCPAFVLEDVIRWNRDYYIASTSVSFNGTAGGTSSGVGSGLLSARPATCTTGVGYWATNQGGSWNAVNGTSTVDGAFYKCTATDTWTKIYTPFAFPHGLTSASTTATHTVDRGTGARFFGHGKFYALSTSTPSGTYADLAVAPSSTSMDSWVDAEISTWINSGTRRKVWTESSETATTTVHTVGDLAANETYGVYVDTVLGANITGGTCSGGVCTSNGSGKITFTYSGGYSSHVFEVEQTTPDTTAPVISSIASSTTATTATITWSTNELATSTVRYGATASYGTASSSSSSVTSHSIVLSGLTSSTLYHFQVSSGDPAFNYATSSDLTFTTASAAAAPSITTSAASSITATTATLNGDITATNGSNATNRGFAYGTSATLATTIATTTEAGSFGTGAYTGSATSLTCNTTYYVRAYTTNTTGTGYGSIVSFLTSPCVQTVTTSAASSVATSTATLNGSISSTGGNDATQSGFAYGTASDLSSVIATSTLGAQSGTASFSSNLTGLTPNTTYYFRTYTTNSAGTGFGSILNFTTSAVTVPTLTVQSASSITATSATGNGTITSIGNNTVTVRGITYGLTTAYGATTTESGSFGTGTYTGSATSLTCNTTYNVRAYATNSAGTGYSSNTTFTTSPCVSTLTTSAASALTQTTATLNGSITDTGGANATESGFAYGTSSVLTTNTATSTLGAQTGTASFSDGVSSLTCNTTYYSRAYATNSAGTAYGSIVSFLTSACAGTVTTQSASSLTLSSATLNGNITATGGANATVRGFAYGLTTAYGATTTEAGSFGTGAYTGSATSLTCNTTYNVRAYSTNSGGTSFGSDTTFTTSACAAPTLTTSAASSLAKTAATLNATISATGGNDATQSGFAYGTTSSLLTVIATSTLGSQSGTVSFSESLSSLTCETPYYFRSYATNVTGTSLGSILTFTTSSCTDPVVTVTTAAPPGGSATRRASNLVARVTSFFSGTPSTASKQNTATANIPNQSISSFINSLVSSGIITKEKAASALSTLSAPSAPAVSFKRDLQLRDKGSDVKDLQTILITKGFLSPGNDTGNFGPLTLKALKEYQTSIGVNPTGYFGPRTRAGVR